jgi:hypothetical protein
MTILLVLAIALFVFWLFGYTTRFLARGGLIHGVLAIAVILFAVWLLHEVVRAF